MQLSKYRELGADWLHVVDLDGAKDGSLANRAIIERLAAQTAVKLQWAADCATPRPWAGYSSWVWRAP